MSTPIKDIFFFRNRMGMVTEDTTILSEVGEYGNFWRTTVATLLDSDRIDSGVESKHAVRVEHTVVFSDSVILFSDKSQFRFEGGDVLSPSSHKITEMTTYEANITIKPLALNDSLYFVGRRGTSSIVYEMYISNQSNRSTEAVDLTVHVQSYIDSNIDRLSGSSVNQMLVLSSQDSRDTLFVYKFYDVGGKREQSAWSKWTFNGLIYSAFILSDDLYIMIDREDAVSETDWILGSGLWRMGRVWDMSAPWIMQPASLSSLNQFERMKMFPQSHLGSFLDSGTTLYESFVNFGEWMSGADGNKSMVGSLKFKTAQFSEAEGSKYSLWVEDLNRREIRTVAHKYIKGRKPMIYGDAKNVRVGFVSEEEEGFRINTVSFEGNLTRRNTVR